MKPSLSLFRRCRLLLLKSKEPRLRDWNLLPMPPQKCGKWQTWNQKNLDYEIETTITLITASQKSPIKKSWNQKNLDYEIETTMFVSIKTSLSCLEIKRTSITRLKHVFGHCPEMVVHNLEIKRTSITRLKHRHDFLPSRFKETGNLKSKEPRLRDWNSGPSVACSIFQNPWNQKNLDYEIETMA